MKHFNSKSRLAKAALVGVALGLLSTSAFASSYTCESGDPADWKSQEEARAMLEAKGYEIRKLKVEGGCYEVYVVRDKEKSEIFINPLTLEIVKIEDD